MNTFALFSDCFLCVNIIFNVHLIMGKLCIIMTNSGGGGGGGLLLIRAATQKLSLQHSNKFLIPFQF